jgi:DNA polymerase bacteriophage-type
MNELVLDFETRSGVDVKKVGAWRYAEDATTEILCLCWSLDGGEVQTWWPGDNALPLTLYAENQANIFISFGDFERAIWQRIMHEEYGLPALPPARWHDIQAVAAMKGLPKNVEDLAHLLNMGDKDMEGNKITLALSKPDRRGYYPQVEPVRPRVIQYCKTDVQQEWGCHAELGFLPQGERKVWLLNQRINMRGIGIDLEYVKASQKIVAQARIPLEREFRELTGVNPSQRDKFMAWMRDQGVALPNLTKETMTELFGESDEEPITDEIEGRLATVRGMVLPDRVHRALTIRNLVNSTSISKLKTMELCTCSDGRARGLLQYHGTGPGRSAGRLIQPQNFPKPPNAMSEVPVEAIVSAIMSEDPEIVEAVCHAGAINAVAAALRHAVKAGPGRVLMSADYAGIQARLVLAVAGQHDKTALMASGADVYCDMATAIYKFPVNKKEHPKERGIGKNSVLGLGFQMGPDTFQVKYARDQLIDFCKTIVKTYRKEWAPKVPYVWYSLEDAAARAVWEPGEEFEAYGVVYQMEGRWLSAQLPSGRKIWYPDPRREKRQAPWDPQDIKQGFSYVSYAKGFPQRKAAFGGQLTENVIMGMERDIMTAAQIKLEKNGFPIVLEVHDEVVCEPMKEDADLKAYEQILLDVEPWVKDIQVPVAVEGWVGERYKK